MKSGRHTAMMAETIALIVKQPRTVPELIRLLDASNPDPVYARIKALRAEGLLYIAGYRQNVRGKAPAVFAWQPSVLANPDVPRPAKEAS